MHAYQYYVSFFLLGSRSIGFKWFSKRDATYKSQYEHKIELPLLKLFDARLTQNALVADTQQKTYFNNRVLYT